MPNNDYATKQDVHKVESQIIELRKEMRDSMGQLRTELVDQMRDTQTELLRAFHNWARPTEIKLRSIVGFEERLGLLEERMSRIERGDTPGHASE